MDILELFDELENEIGLAKKAVFSNKAMVDTDKCKRIIDELKNALPTAIREAKQIAENRERIVSEASALAEKTVKEAEMRAEQIISESELLKRAEAEAETIKAEARQYSETMRHGAKQYVEALFIDLENFLTDSITTVRNNREELRGSLIKDKKDK